MAKSGSTREGLSVADSLPLDIFNQIFGYLLEDLQTLTRVGLVCRGWRELSLPFLLHNVDLSCHNNGRLPEHENESFSLLNGIVMSDYSEEYRPNNLLSRQRAFLRFMTDRSELTSLVKSFTWTLIWLDFEETQLSDIDQQTWIVFERMRNVTRLDLASLHDIPGQPYIRENPCVLFSAVTELRLVGWMHRSLVTSIVNSIDARKLVTIDLYHLSDEGALPDGQPMPKDWNSSYCTQNESIYTMCGISNELLMRQESGDAAIFPGPMWLPLRLLRQYHLTALSDLKLSFGPLLEDTDQRNYKTLFQEVSELVRSTKSTLKHIFIGVSECPTLHCQDADLLNTCATSRIRIDSTAGPTCFDLSSALLHCLLPVLIEEEFPRLQQINLRGFRSLRTSESRLMNPPDPEITWNMIDRCSHVDENFTKTNNESCHKPFTGYDYCPTKSKSGHSLEDIFRPILETS